jgi:hypothetical protein
MGPNFSKEGITKDLEAMKASGIGGATIFNITSSVQESQVPMLNTPWPGNTYRGAAYWEAVGHAAAEAERLGLDLGLHNTVGYSTTGGPWIDEPRSMQQLVWTKTVVEGPGPLVVRLAAPIPIANEGWGKTGRTTRQISEVGVLAVPEGDGEGDGVLRLEEVLDLTGKMSAEGELTWTAPGGRWVVYRLAHGSTLRGPHPVPDDVIGKVLEADKLSLEQTEYHWRQVLEPLKQHVGRHLGKSMRHVLIDSYEAGPQNWTPKFREEFAALKGYDPLPWLVTMPRMLAGDGARIVGSKEMMARFEWDYRDVVERLFYDRGWRPGADMVRGVGCELHFEPYGGAFSTIDGAALADVPMGEFWTRGDGSINAVVVAAARAGGRRLVGAEAFTGRPEASRWTEVPGDLKRSADGAFASGVNRMILHTWVHQPFDDRYLPGLAMGWWGTHFGRHQTWAESGRAFFEYLGRVQAVMQWGETPVDVLAVGKLPGVAGVDADVISWRGLRGEVGGEVKVKDGRVVLGSGRSYRVMVIGESKLMLPEDVRVIGRLLSEGAVVVSGRPSRSPSMQGYPKADAEVQALAEKIWGKSAGAGKGARKVGLGRLYAEAGLEEVLEAEGIAPLVRVTDAAIRVAARQEAGVSVYFVANTSADAKDVRVSFRGAGQVPELWDAERVKMRDADDWRLADGRTEVRLSLLGHKSMFVVFRRPVEGGQTGGRQAEAATAEMPAGKTLDVAGPWRVEFSSPVEKVAPMTLGALGSLTEQADPAVKYFAGTVTYVGTFEVAAEDVGRPVVVHLGEVHSMARVWVNGVDHGVVWHKPFQVEARGVKAGVNELRVAVTNSWHNRLVGDEQHPADVEFGRDRGPNMGRAVLEYPAWFLNHSERPSVGRRCFVIWHYHRADTPLMPAGLVGPVAVKIGGGERR